jgi:uncharacterized membrane protein YczE
MLAAVLEIPCAWAGIMAALTIGRLVRMGRDKYAREAVWLKLKRRLNI